MVMYNMSLHHSVKNVICILLDILFTIARHILHMWLSFLVFTSHWQETYIYLLTEAKFYMHLAFAEC